MYAAQAHFNPVYFSDTRQIMPIAKNGIPYTKPKGPAPSTVKSSDTIRPTASEIPPKTVCLILRLDRMELSLESSKSGTDFTESGLSVYFSPFMSSSSVTPNISLKVTSLSSSGTDWSDSHL